MCRAPVRFSSFKFRVLMNLISSDGVSRAHLNAVQSPQPWSHSLDIWQINSRIYNDIKFPAAFPSSLVTTKMRYFSECWRESSEIWASKKNFSLKSIISMIFTTPFKSCLSLTPTEFIYFFFMKIYCPEQLKTFHSPRFSIGILCCLTMWFTFIILRRAFLNWFTKKRRRE